MAEGQAAMLAMPDAGTFLERLENFYRSWVQKLSGTTS